MSHSETNSKKPVTRGKKYDYLGMRKGKPRKEYGSSGSQSDQVDEHELLGAEGVNPHLFEASCDEEFDFVDGSARYETGQPDVTSHKQYFVLGFISRFGLS